MTKPSTPRDPIAIARRLRADGNIPAAISMLERASRIPSHRTASLLELGALLNAAGAMDQAVQPYLEVLKSEPKNVAARLGLADSYLSSSRLEESKAIYLDLASENPGNVDVQLGLGECALHEGDLETAFNALSAAIRKRPGDAEIQFNLAQVMQLQGTTDRAEQLYRAAIDTLGEDPLCATVWNKLGSLFSDRGDFHLAGEAFRNAIQIQPGVPAGYNNLGEICRELGDLQSARASFDTACQLDPNYIPARYNRSLLNLLAGKYTDAWKDYELRWMVPPLANDPGKPVPPRWNGESLGGKSLLLHAEQGIGDTIQFLRFLPSLLSSGARIKLAIQPQLKHLLKDLPEVSLFPVMDISTISADYHCPLMSIPFHAGTTLESVPVPMAIPPATPEKKAIWKERLPDRGRRIAICWQGNPKAAADRGRSPPLSCFKPLADLAATTLVSVQKSDGLDQLVEIHGSFNLIVHGNDFDSGPEAFSDTIAILEQVDLVITGDTAIAHLAGSMGKPTWIALKHIPDWRWGIDGESCRWYPTARLFRQKSQGDWSSVFSRMAATLNADPRG